MRPLPWNNSYDIHTYKQKKSIKILCGTQHPKNGKQRANVTFQVYNLECLIEGDQKIFQNLKNGKVGKFLNIKQPWWNEGNFISQLKIEYKVEVFWVAITF